MGLTLVPMDWLQVPENKKSSAVEVDLVSPSKKEDQQLMAKLHERWAELGCDAWCCDGLRFGQLLSWLQTCPQR